MFEFQFNFPVVQLITINIIKKRLEYLRKEISEFLIYKFVLPCIFLKKTLKGMRCVRLDNRKVFLSILGRMT